MEPKLAVLRTHGMDADFKGLCLKLDDYLNDIVGGEKNRQKYIPHNTTGDIGDALVAYAAGEAVGCAAFRMIDEWTAEVKRMFVLKEHRGRGVAREIMQTLETAAKEEGFSRLVLESGEPLKESLSLYLKLGYAIIENYGPYSEMSESICMAKQIAESR